MPGIAVALSSLGLRLELDVSLTSTSAIDRFLPLHFSARDGVFPPAVLASALLPDGTGAARTLLRSLLPSGSAPLASVSCSQLASLDDPISGGASRPTPGAGVGGVRLERQEAVATVASLWLARADCGELPLAAAIPLSPTLVFISAYTDDPRDVTLPASSSRTLLSALPTAAYGALRGILALVLAVSWNATGVPSAQLLNMTADRGALPAVHSLSWTSGALASALPPYALLAGYAYTATASAQLGAAWAWDTEAFLNGSAAFPPAPPPQGAGVTTLPPELLTVGPEAAWSPAPQSANSTPGRSAALALVTLPPRDATVAASPASGTAVVTEFQLSASGGNLPPGATAADLTQSTPRSVVSPVALASSLLTAFPMPPEAASAMLAAVQSGSATSAEPEAWCAPIEEVASAGTLTVDGSGLPAWALRLGPLAHALDVAAGLDAAMSAPPTLGAAPDLTTAAAVSAALLLATGPAAYTSAARLCSEIIASLVTALPLSPLNASAAPLAFPGGLGNGTSSNNSSNSSSLRYSFRVGTRPLESLPPGTVVSLSPPVFSSPDAALTEALLYSVPVQLSTVGGSSFVNLASLSGVILPLTQAGFNLSAATPVPLYVIVLDGTRAVSVGVTVVPLLPPLPEGAAVNATTLSIAVAGLAAGVTLANATATPLATLLNIATLASMLGALSTGQVRRCL